MGAGHKLPSISGGAEYNSSRLIVSVSPLRLEGRAG